MILLHVSVSECTMNEKLSCILVFLENCTVLLLQKDGKKLQKASALDGGTLDNFRAYME